MPTLCLSGKREAYTRQSDKIMLTDGATGDTNGNFFYIDQTLYVPQALYRKGDECG